MDFYVYIYIYMYITADLAADSVVPQYVLIHVSMFDIWWYLVFI